MRFKKRAFTIIELMVVVAIIGTLAGIVVVSYDNSQKKSRDSRRIADFDALKTAILLYKEDTNSVPPNRCGGAFCLVPASASCAPSGDPNYSAHCSTTTLSELIIGNYIDKIPSDPGGNVYYYYTGTLIAFLETYHGTTGYNGSYRVDGGVGTSGGSTPHLYCSFQDQSDYCIKTN